MNSKATSSPTSNVARAQAAPVTLSAKQRADLLATIRRHPDLRAHLNATSKLSSMSKAELVDLAAKLSIDISLITKKAAHFEKSGEVSFEIAFTVDALSVTRSARIRYVNRYDTAPADIADAQGDTYQTEVVVEIAADDSVYRSMDGKSGKPIRTKLKPRWIDISKLFDDAVLGTSIVEHLYELVDIDAASAGSV